MLKFKTEQNFTLTYILYIYMYLSLFLTTSQPFTNQSMVLTSLRNIEGKIENIDGKGENAVTSIFSISDVVFPHFQRQIKSFHIRSNCFLQMAGKPTALKYGRLVQSYGNISCIKGVLINSKTNRTCRSDHWSTLLDIFSKIYVSICTFVEAPCPREVLTDLAECTIATGCSLPDSREELNCAAARCPAQLQVVLLQRQECVSCVTTSVETPELGVERYIVK